MDRSERFYKIDQMLHSRGLVPLDSFLDELGVSLATFKRDLEYLPNRFNAPLDQWGWHQLSSLAHKSIYSDHIDPDYHKKNFHVNP